MVGFIINFHTGHDFRVGDVIIPKRIISATITTETRLVVVMVYRTTWLRILLRYIGFKTKINHCKVIAI